MNNLTAVLQHSVGRRSATCLRLRLEAYFEKPVEGPDTKRVQFSDAHKSLMAKFPSELISKWMASHAIQEAFLTHRSTV